MKKILHGLAIVLIAGSAMAAKINAPTDINNFNVAVDARVTLAGLVPTTRQIFAGTGLSGGGDLSADRTLALDLTRANTWTGAGTFSAGIVGNVTGTVTGNAGTATALQTARTLAITGDLTWTSPSFDGSGNVTAVGTLATVNANVGSFGDATHVGVFTVDAKGRLTAATSTAITFPSLAAYLQAANNLSDVSSASTSRTNLGLGTAAVQNTGTSGANVPLLSTTNTWALQQVITATAGTPSLLVDAAAGVSKAFAGSTSGSKRWQLSMPNGTAESGSNAGSDFQLLRFDDTGTLIDSPMQVTRQTGAALFRDGLTVTGTTTSTAFSGPITGAVTGNASTATTLANARTIAALTGDVTATGQAFNGSANTTAAATLATTQPAVHTWSLLQTFNGGITTAGSTVALLPTCNTAFKGGRYYVTDGLSPAFLSPPTGGGAVVTPVFCNGTAWVVG